MRIRKINVEELFDYYSYEIVMKEHDAISIIHAPNGYGKTTVFKMVNYLLELDIIGISAVPFKKFVVEFTEGTILRVKRVEEKIIERRGSYLTGFLEFEIENIAGKIYDFSISTADYVLERIKEDGLEQFIRRMEMRRRRVPSEEREELENIQNKYERFAEQLNIIRESIKVNFIDSDRLFSSNKQARTREIVRGDKVTRDEMIRMRRDGRTEEYSEQINKSENIIRAAREILFRIQRARQIYSSESEKKDRNFPDRLVQYVDSQSEFFDDEQINEQLDDLEKKRLELEKAGLVLPGKKTLAPTASIDDTMRKFYTLYIKDTFEKLSVYDTIKAKLELFIEIINTKTVFSNKQMRIDNEKGVVFEPLESKSGKKHVIPLEKLSSGEKHDFIMFYELIFNADRTSVFLIDEPEISLHVAWQMEFIDILERICKLNGTQAIIATHSPDIVNGHDDLLISLGVN